MMDRQKRHDQADSDDEAHLHEIAGEHSPRAARERDDRHQRTEDNQRAANVHLKHRGHENANGVQPYPRGEKQDRNLKPRVKLFGSRAIARPHGLHPGD